MSAISKRILVEFPDKEFRDSYVESRVRNLVAYQIRALRDLKKWSQEEMATRLGVSQSVVSRLEDPEYGRLTITTLLKLAFAFDVGLTIKFSSHEEFLNQTKDISPTALQVNSYDETRVNNSVKKVTDSQMLFIKPSNIYFQTFGETNVFKVINKTSFASTTPVLFH